MKRLLSELRRRNVFRVAGVYAIAAWFIMQLVDVLMNALELPSWVDGFVVLLLVAGFLVALVFAWMFELGPDGIVRTERMSSEAMGTGARPADYAIVVALVALLGVGVFQAARGPADATGTASANGTPSAQRAEGVEAEPPIDGGPSIAVLPFTNLSSERDQEYFSDGLTEELITQLARFNGLRIAARTSSFAFKDRNEDTRAIGRQLGVTHVLDGSVRKSGMELRIAARLVDAQTGFQLWSRSFDAPLVDVFAIQEQIGKDVADTLGVALGVSDVTTMPGGTTNVEAYDRYLRAMALLNRGTPPGDLQRAAELFHQAVDLDSGFAVARANQALALSRMLIFVPEQTEQTLAELNDVVASALEHAPNHWSSHLARILTASLRRDWFAVDESYRKVLALPTPPDPTAASSLAVVPASMGRNAEAIRGLQKARRDDPLSIDVAAMLQQNLFVAGRIGESQADFERTLDLPGAHEMPEHVALMRVWSGDDPKAVEAQFRRFLDQLTIPMPAFQDLANVLDDPVAARTVLSRAFADPTYQDPTRLMFIAWHAAHFGDDELAGAALRRSLVDMNGMFVPAIWFPDLARYRKTSEFKQLARDLKLYDYWRATGNWGDHCRPVGADDFECD